MTYQPGSVRLATVVEEDDSSCDYVDFVPPDYRRHLSLDNDGGRWPMGSKIALLPHQCDAWVIGGIDDIRNLINDLLTALADMPGSEE